ncbi:methylglyoxal synthase [Paraliobacillus quinghaiensis]|uniref:Methylglyoxal synthase n=1 Tax=Paraliobacillus quinghaiensis TaxID=470815 RepID=A0A917WQE1_9BACI|nr:methylglyoxal synthase [Paraliobacillus quinghaiensis]GGM22973.1 methylglyoxal synthase [Paraliobacillus quinghaiensis]
MKIALVAHDKKKEAIIQFSISYAPILKKHELFATGTTGKKINEATGLPITRFLSGPLGGDQQIGAKIATNEMDMVIFFRDPLTSQPHEPDISALMRLCDVHQIPLVTNLAGAEVMIRALEAGFFDWRNLLKNEDN